VIPRLVEMEQEYKSGLSGHKRAYEAAILKGDRNRASWQMEQSISALAALRGVESLIRAEAGSAEFDQAGNIIARLWELQRKIESLKAQIQAKVAALKVAPARDKPNYSREIWYLEQDMGSLIGLQSKHIRGVAWFHARDKTQLALARAELDPLWGKSKQELLALGEQFARNLAARLKELELLAAIGKPPTDPDVRQVQILVDKLRFRLSEISFRIGKVIAIPYEALTSEEIVKARQAAALAEAAGSLDAYVVSLQIDVERMMGEAIAGGFEKRDDVVKSFNSVVEWVTESEGRLPQAVGELLKAKSVAWFEEKQALVKQSYDLIQLLARDSRARAKLVQMGSDYLERLLTDSEFRSEQLLPLAGNLLVGLASDELSTRFEAQYEKLITFAKERVRNRRSPDNGSNPNAESGDGGGQNAGTPTDPPAAVTDPTPGTGAAGGQNAGTPTDPPAAVTDPTPGTGAAGGQNSDAPTTTSGGADSSGVVPTTTSGGADSSAAAPGAAPAASTDTPPAAGSDTTPGTGAAGGQNAGTPTAPPGTADPSGVVPDATLPVDPRIAVVESYKNVARWIEERESFDAKQALDDLDRFVQLVVNDAQGRELLQQHGVEHLKTVLREPITYAKWAMSLNEATSSEARQRLERLEKLLTTQPSPETVPPSGG
jgi:hypothetical protein